ncbi:hypothetical protein FZC83_02010 [Rossellomorea marisflavi]|uniref:Uncharacterized protein n=1 Tax=Rossellomorea marisflavi TaxID=189381 RepID=A0A5D4RZH7_9BACI|nr:hypothetical protein [Rossellomorea marisflavi]TYS56370.1 hypothetical protein FZC83_02010 [Rossellomorea marisflavi]
MDFYTEVVPVIKKYMNRVFEASDGYGASISFYDKDIRCEWEESKGKVRKVILEFYGGDSVVETEIGFQMVLQLIKLLSELELRQQEENQKITNEYKKLLNEVINK